MHIHNISRSCLYYYSSADERVGPVVGLHAAQSPLPQCSRKHVVFIWLQVEVRAGQGELAGRLCHVQTTVKRLREGMTVCLGRREGGKEVGREGGREGGKEVGREGGREEGRERYIKNLHCTQESV